MKKILILALLSIFSASLFALDAKVLSVSGKVQVQRGANWVDLKPGDVIRKGEVIQTGFKSEAQISLTSGNQNSKITVEAMSRLTIEQLAENPKADKASVYVATGTVKSEIKKTTDRRASYTVRGPVATASVRGTVITVSTGYDSASIETSEGNAAFYETPADARNPVISSADEDKSFASLSEDEVNENLYPVSATLSTSVKAGQVSKVAGNETQSVYDIAISNAVGLAGSTETVASDEVVTTATGIVDGARESVIPTSAINVKVRLVP
mgnify:CR=1 FL=1